MEDGFDVQYSDDVPATVAHYLPRSVIGKHYAGERMRNADFVADLAAVHQGWTSVERDILEVA